MCGASGGIGQPLSLLLKNSPLVTELSLYDIVHTPGVAADLSHIDTFSKVVGFNGPENLEKALHSEFYKKPTICYLNFFALQMPILSSSQLVSHVSQE